MNIHDRAVALLETGDPFGVTSDTPGAGSVHRREVSSGYRPCQLSPRPVHRGLGFGPAAFGSSRYPRRWTVVNHLFHCPGRPAKGAAAVTGSSYISVMY